MQSDIPQRRSPPTRSLSNALLDNAAPSSPDPDQMTQDIPLEEQLEPCHPLSQSMTLISKYFDIEVSSISKSKKLKSKFLRYQRGSFFDVEVNIEVTHVDIEDGKKSSISKLCCFYIGVQYRSASILKCMYFDIDFRILRYWSTFYWISYSKSNLSK